MSTGAALAWATNAAARWLAHRASCLTCFWAGQLDHPEDYCPAGWELLSNHMEAQRALLAEGTG